MIENLEDSALALYDGGWRSDDKEELMIEYELTENEAFKICQLLDNFDKE